MSSGISTKKIISWTVDPNMEDIARKQLGIVYKHGVDALVTYWEYLEGNHKWPQPYANISGTQYKADPFEGIRSFANLAPDHPERNHPFRFSFDVQLKKYQRRDFEDRTLYIHLPGVSITMSDHTGWNPVLMRDLALNVSEAIVSMFISEMNITYETDELLTSAFLPFPTEETSINVREWLEKPSSKYRHLKGRSCLRLSVYHNDEEFTFVGRS